MGLGRVFAPSTLYGIWWFSKDDVPYTTSLGDGNLDKGSRLEMEGQTVPCTIPFSVRLYRSSYVFSFVDCTVSLTPSASLYVRMFHHTPNISAIRNYLSYLV